jgi:hypothetical protein
MMMQMTYTASTTVTILVSGWNTDGNWYYYTASLCAVFAIALLYEAIATLRINAEHLARDQIRIVANRSDTDALSVMYVTPASQPTNQPTNQPTISFSV